MYEDAPSSATFADPRLEPVARKVAARLFAQLEASPPAGVDPIEVADYQRRQGERFVQQLVAMLMPYADKVLARITGGKPQGVRAVVTPPAAEAAPDGQRGAADLWTPSARTKANLAAMELAATKSPAEMSAADLAVLSRYSGWGGLSIERAAPALASLPAEFPRPEPRGMIHEYYTPTKVAEEVVRAVAGFMDELPRVKGKVLALEPSAGIGRFVNAAKALPDLAWTAVEYSALSSKMLAASRPDITVWYGPFERWVRENAARVEGKLGLVLSNPPYGARGAAVTEDSDRGYREKKAYAYFLRRAADLLAPGGLGVFLIPSGFMSGQSSELRSLREKLLRTHHLVTAFRLPSELFPGALLVTDLVFLQKRPGTLDEVHPDDAGILAGGFFKDNPQLILGKEVGAPGDDDDQTAKPRWGYEVQGTFTALPPIVRRPWCDACDVSHLRAAAELEEVLPPEPEHEEAPPAQVDGGSVLQRANDLGRRFSAYARDVSAGEDRRAVWPELHADLMAWTAQNGDPWRHTELLTAAERAPADGPLGGLAAFKSAWVPPSLSWGDAGSRKAGKLIPGLQAAPTYEQPVPVAAREDVVALADWIYRTTGRCSFMDLAAAHAGEPGAQAASGPAQAWVQGQLDTLVRAGWCVDCEDEKDDWALVVPERDYLSGNLWPKVDRARAPLGRNVWGRALAQAQLDQQQAALLKTINPVTFDELERVSPMLGWVPVDLLSGFITETMIPQWERDRLPVGWRVELERRDGFLLPRGTTYDTYAQHEGMSAEAIELLGMINGDLKAFKVKKAKGDDETAAEKRKRRADQFTAKFVQYVSESTERRNQLAETYNRLMRGFVLPGYPDEPLEISRWTAADGAPRLKPHQIRGARRVLANRGGLLAFGVGVGKTYTGLGILARARQEGWARRPVVVVPNSIVWKWFKDFQRVLPDYRVAVIGSKPARVEAPFSAGALRPTATAEAWAAANKRSRRKVELLGRLAEGAWTPVGDVAGPDVAAVGHLRELVAAGALAHKPAKPRIGADTDSPEERAIKWRRFQAGEFDAVLLTYSMLGRTRMDEEAVRIYADRQQSIKRQIEQDKRAAGEAKARIDKKGKQEDDDTDADEGGDDGGKKPKEMTERQRAILAEGTAAWIAEKMELPEGQQYDPGLTWDEIGVDLLLIDEAQNFKNLYTPERRDGGIPKFMGGGGEGSNRAWQLDFRCASVRRRAGGRGVVLLSATPAKNSPLEFYNLLQYLDENLWPNAGVHNAEHFIENFLQIENQLVITDKMKAEERPAVTGFINLDDLRDIVFRYGDFKSAEDVGLKLPEVTATPVWVQLDAKQNALYGEIVSRIEDLLDKSKERNAEGKKAAGEILGLLQRLAMITLHPGLMESYDWKEVKKANIDPYSPKIAAMVSNVLKQRTCGHIIFAEPVASHWWMKEALVQAGIPEGRIAILNGSTAKDTAVRQEIAERFNGDPIRGVEPDFDVVIANSIAYEGIDLQVRTCAIHHMDLPWEPATIEQRNGRGVRQGNTLSNISINFYLAQNSMDGARYALIQGKHGWMKDLLDSQIKETSNPLATATMGKDELLLMMSRDPEATKKKLDELREKAREEAIARKVIEARRTLRGVNGRFRQAEAMTDPVKAAALRDGAEAMLKQVFAVGEARWPWVRHVGRVRDTPISVPTGTGTVPGALPPTVYPLWITGSCFGVAKEIKTNEQGRVAGVTFTDRATHMIGLPDPDAAGEAGLLPLGSLIWTSTARLKGIETALPAEAIMPACPDDLQLAWNAEGELKGTISRSGWAAAAWHLAPDAWRAAWWPKMAANVRAALGSSNSYGNRNADIPLRDGAEGVRLMSGHDFAWYGQKYMPDSLFPPTEAGWAEFLERAKGSGIKWGELDRAASWWWKRRMPRG